MTRRGNAKRRLLLESLERRMLLAADARSPLGDFDTEVVFWDGQQLPMKRGQWIVQFDASAEDSPLQILGKPERDLASDAQRWIKRRRPAEQIGANGSVERWTYQFSDTMVRDAMLNAFSELQGVVSVEPDFVVGIDLVPDDPDYSTLWGLHNEDDVDIDAPEAWDLTTGSSSLVVGVIDSGVDYNHEDLAANMWINPAECPAGIGTCIEDGIDDDNNGYVDDFYGWDFINNDNDPFDDHSHGTHVAGTIAAVGNNATGVVGVSWNTKIMALKFLGAGGTGSTSDAVEAVQYATMMRRDHGVNIRLTNNSWGGGGESQALEDAIEESRAQDMLFVAAAGNDSLNNDSIAHYPSNYELDNIISVASITESDELSSFSNFGATSVDLGAPGSSVYSTIPRNGYGFKSGTSMASPHVAGVAALAWATDSSATYAEVRDAIFDSVDATTELEGQTVTGGRLNAFQTLERMGLFATPVSPAQEEILAVAPTTFTLDFSEPVHEFSITPFEFSVNGQTADSFALLDADTVSFSFTTSPVVDEGSHSARLQGGNISSATTQDAVAALEYQFFYNPTPLVVSAIDPPDGSTLSLPDPVLRLDFSEPLAPGSISLTDLELSVGRVEKVTIIDSDTVEYQLAGIRTESPLVIELPADRIIDEDGFFNEPFTATFGLDLTIADYRGRWITPAPLGSSVRSSRLSGTWHTGSDEDRYRVDLDEDQTLSLALTPRSSGGMAPAARITLLSPDGSELTFAETVGASSLVIDSVAITRSGEYTIVVQNAGPNDGQYDLELALNASLEAEPFLATTNDSLATAQPIDEEIGVAAGVSQVAVTGELEGVDSDWFSLVLPAEEWTTLAVASPGGAPAITLHASDGSTLATGSLRGTHSRIVDFAAAETGRVFVHISGTDSEYVLSVTGGAALDEDEREQDHNGSFETAQDIDTSLHVAGYVGNFGAAEPVEGGSGSTSPSAELTEIEGYFFPSSMLADAEVTETDAFTRIDWDQPIDPRTVLGQATTRATFVPIDSAPEGDQARDILYTPDGAHYLMAHRESENVLVYDAQTHEVIADIPVGGKPADLEITPDGALALTANTVGNTVTVIDLQSLTHVADIPTSAAWPFRVHATADSATAAVATGEDEYSVISLTSMRETLRIPVTGIGTTATRVTSAPSGRIDFAYTDFALTPDGTKLLTPGTNAEDDSVALVIDLATGERLAEHVLDNRPPTMLVSADGSTAYAVSYDSFRDADIAKIDLSDFSVSERLTGPRIRNAHMKLTPDEQFLIGSGLNSLMFVDLADGSLSNEISIGSTENFVISHDGQYVLARQVIDIASQEQVGSLPVFLWLDLVAASPTELTGIQSRSLVGENYAIIDLDGTEPVVVSHHEGGSDPEGDTPTAMELTADGLTAITANYDSKNLSVVDLATRTVTEWIDVGAKVDSLSITPDGRYAVAASSGDDDFPVVLVDLVNGTLDATLTGSFDRPRDVLISADGSQAFVVSTGANDSSDEVHFIDIDGVNSSVATSLQVGNTANGSIQHTNLALSPDGSVLAVPVTRDAELVLIDTDSRTELARLKTDTFPTEATFAADGRYLYVMNQQGGSVTAIRVDGADSAVLKTIGDLARPASMALDDQGEYLYVATATFSAPGQVHVIDTNTFEVVQVVTLGSDIDPVRVHYDANVLYIAGIESIPLEIPLRDNVSSLMRVLADGPDSRYIDETLLSGRSRLVNYSAPLTSAVTASFSNDGLDVVDFSEVATGDEDFYHFLPEVGDEVVVSAVLPGSGPGQIENTLDLAIEVFDPQGALVASNTGETLSFTTASIGRHTLRVYARQVTRGEYVLSIDGVSDPAGPSLAKFSPFDGQTDVAPEAPLVMEFDQPVVLGTGEIQVRRAGDDSLYATVDVAGGAVAIDGSSATITLPTEWELGTRYYVLIDSGTFRSLGGDGSTGIADASLWDFEVGFGFDYGDAPAPYPVLKADDGPGHSIRGPQIGSERDRERDGVPSTLAGGDDSSGIDDEDGITFSVVAAGQTDATLTVEVQGVSTGAFVDAWVDFDGDGFWGGSGEQIVASMPAVDGTNTYSFDVPAWASAGQSFARIRISTQGQLGVVGRAADGEVQDELVTIEPPQSSSLLFGERRDASENSTGGNTLDAGDLDGDGDLDLVFTRDDSSRLAWLENDGTGEFTSRVISSDRSRRAARIADINGDGYLDVVASGSSVGLVWHRNNGRGSFERFEIDDQYTFADKFAAVDFDLDGDQDVLLYDSFNDEIVLSENDGEETFTSRVLVTDVNTTNVSYVDLDRDGDLDVVTDDDGTSWYENIDGVFAQRSISSAGSSLARHSDIDGDGDQDILTLEGSQLRWYENNGDQQFSAHTLFQTFSSKAVEVADLDGDGDRDLITTGVASSAEITWYENDGDQTFTPRRLESGSRRPEDIVAADLDGDSDLDVAYTTFNNGISWFRNSNGLPPEIRSLAPVRNSLMHRPDGNLVVTFDQPVRGGTGQITIFRADDDSVVETIAADSAQVSVSADRMVIDPTTEFLPQTTYYVQLDAAVATNLDEDRFAGLLDQSWTFRTLVGGTDYGDAPDATAAVGPGDYETQSTGGGPSHRIIGELYLGHYADGDDGTLQNTAASADNADGVRDDEDGVPYPDTDLNLITGTQPAVRLNATNLTESAATLTGWIDYDFNGQFDSDESAQVMVPPGTVSEYITLTFPTVPESTPRETYARFRLGQDAVSVLPVGAAAGGEVEDHVVRIWQPGFDSAVGSAVIEEASGGPVTASTDQFGKAVAPLGDINGDGVDDVAISAPGDDTSGSDAGAVYVMLLNADGSVKSEQKIVAGASGLPFDGSDRFGLALAAAGDLDHDGIRDLAVLSESTGNTPGSSLVYVMLNADGTAKAFQHHPIRIDGRDTSVDSIAAIGDLDGDGVGDFALGKTDAWSSVTITGGVYLMMPNADGSPRDYRYISSEIGGGPALEFFDDFGTSVTSLGDLNSNGVNDLAVGAMRHDGGTSDTGAVHLLFMNRDGTVQSHQLIDGLGANEPSLSFLGEFAVSLTTLDDRNGDGINELVVGASRHNSTNASFSGVVYVMHLHPDGSVQSRTTLESGLNGVPALSIGERFGGSIAPAGDVNGDGQVDLIIGSPDRNNEGAAYILMLDDANLQLEVVPDSVAENIGSLTAVVRRDPAGDLSEPLVVSLASSQPEDASVPSSVAIAAGELASQPFQITILDDAVSGDDVSVAVAATARGFVGASDSFVVVDDDQPAPMVESIEVNEGAATRSQVISVAVHFDSPVDHSALGSAFRITNADTGVEVGRLNIDASDVDGKTSALITFGGDSTEVNGSLSHGNYQLRIDAGFVRTPGGLPMEDHLFFGGQAVDAFFRLFGDSNGDRDVDGLDYTLFTRTFLRTTPHASYNGEFDFDGDGDVDGLDYQRFAEGFLRRLPPPE